MRTLLVISSVFFALVLGACTGSTMPVDVTATEPTVDTSTVDSLPPSDELLDVALALQTFFSDPSDESLRAATSAVGERDGDTANVSEILHGAHMFVPVEAGRQTIAAPIGFNQHRQVTIRTPVGYDPAIAYPLIVAYHTWGGTADRILDRFEELLGDDIEQFVVAAPDDYRQTVLDAPPPVSAEHVSVWRTVRQARHIDSNRIYAMGYSLGGETVMTVTSLHGHALAAAIGMANTFGFPSDVPGLWERFARNLGDVPILHAWGAEDSINIPGLNFRESPATLVELNRRLGALLGTMPGVAYTGVEIQGVGHEDAYPPRDLILDHLSRVRAPLPTEIEHTFRYIHQADTAWVEGHEWLGDGWLEAAVDFEATSEDTALQDEADAIDRLLGSIKARVAGNEITLTTTHLADLTIWLNPELVDLEHPITIVHNGVAVFDGLASPDLAVALSQAERTRDFDRIRWAGIRIVDGDAHVVTASDEFPEISRGVTLGSP